MWVIIECRRPYVFGMNLKIGFCISPMLKRFVAPRFKLTEGYSKPQASNLPKAIQSPRLQTYRRFVRIPRLQTYPCCLDGIGSA